MEGTPTSASAPPRADSGNDPMVIAGWIAVIFAPIIAVIIGFLLRSKGDRRGNPILAVSLTICAIGLIVAVIVISAVSGAGSSGGLACSSGRASRPSRGGRSRPGRAAPRSTAAAPAGRACRSPRAPGRPGGGPAATGPGTP